MRSTRRKRFKNAMLVWWGSYGALAGPLDVVLGRKIHDNVLMTHGAIMLGTSLVCWLIWCYDREKERTLNGPLS